MNTLYVEEKLFRKRRISSRPALSSLSQFLLSSQLQVFCQINISFLCVYFRLQKHRGKNYFVLSLPKGLKGLLKSHYLFLARFSKIVTDCQRKDDRRKDGKSILNNKQINTFKLIKRKCNIYFHYLFIIVY